MSRSYRDLFVSAADGLRLYARDYGPEAGEALPIVCLSGLARSSEDFHDLAQALSGDADRPRRVLALDYRGRGLSEWDKDWRHYDVTVEMGDVLQVLKAAGIGKAVFVGTSRGGLITMALAAARPSLIAGAVLNDVGPVLEAKGLMRIRGYVGKLPTPRTMQEAVLLLRERSGTQFPGFTEEQWEAMARGTWRESEGQLVLNYDPNLMKPMEALDLEKPLPDLWPLFEGLKPFPVLAIRGELSDLLTAQTLEAMRERHPRLQAVTVPNQGHAPALDGDLIERIKHFIRELEVSTQH
ncbi:pimeloyl-ACP methyl ester carboxylesterase [Microvirga flocculans]|uniref:Pimeloyl-ACP methyl ester carboxylesterase n=1 Tax=Microvirga flocculans TaxID=217168 RepID=A0A7W6IDI3_9HYPH|nr:alpha/beta hydrolase [Microvirga flocculans]MBB4039492.1 pimeloyl-ACP methyl ester carboxylesterase [Microvirga flocculans]